jgi:HK97 gp10 family phage protein
MASKISLFRTQSENLKKDVENAIKVRMSEAGMIAETNAKMNAPVKFGYHRQNIGHETSRSGLGTKVFANAKYAPYLEFGTGGSIMIPSGFDDLALQFKGNGVKTINLPARPHIIPAAQKAMEFFNKKIELDISRL